MIRPPRSDFWQVGLVHAPITALLGPARPDSWRERVTWLPDPGPWRYLADPFGLRRRGTTHIFVEAFDYRTKHAVIEHHEFGPDLAWRGQSVVLSRPFHLSYPYIVQDRGEVFMIPECHQTGEIALYRAQARSVLSIVKTPPTPAWAVIPVLTGIIPRVYSPPIQLNTSLSRSSWVDWVKLWRICVSTC